MANERSASSGNLSWDGVEVNHQFSKSLRAERLLSAAVAESRRPAAHLLGAAPRLRARDRARVRAHGAPTTRRSRAATRSSASTRRCAPRSWCCDCPKCRFVFLALAPFSSPDAPARDLRRDLLDDEAQFEGFALLTATRRPQAVRVRRRGAGERRGDPAARRATRAGASSASCGGSAAEVLPQASARRGRSRRGARAQRRARGAGRAAGGRPCASRSLKARASASGAPAARSARSPRSCSAACRGADRRGGVRRARRRGPARDAARCPRRRRRARRRAPPTALARLRCARPLAGRLDPPAGAAARCARPACRSRPRPALWLAERGGGGVIGVTGTKGKSTTAALAAHLARAAGRDVELAGNIGVPGARSARRPAGRRWRSLELSSYQIADLDSGPRGRGAHEPLPRARRLARIRAAPTARRSCACFGCPECAPRVLTAATQRSAAIRRGGRRASSVRRAADGWDVAPDGGCATAGERRCRRTSCRCAGEHNALNLCAALTRARSARRRAAAAAAARSPASRAPPPARRPSPSATA